MENAIKEFIVNNKDQLILFHLFDEGEVDQVLSFFEVVRHKKGDTLFQEGDEGDYVGIIISGKLDVKKHTEFKGKQVIIASLREGSFVGEMSLINENEPRSATVVVSEDAELILLTRESLDALLEQYPKIGIKILKGLNQVLSVRLRKTVERLTSIF